MAAAHDVVLKDVAPADFVKAYAAHLKRSGRLAVPKWADLCKTGPHKELPPRDRDWFYTRAASVCRKIYIRGGSGVGAMRKVYGGSKNRGVRPSHFGRSSGNIVRSVFRSLEKMGLVEKDPRGGRRITTVGQRDCDRISAKVAKGSA